MKPLVLAVLFSGLMLFSYSLIDCGLSLITEVGYQHRVPWAGSTINGLNALASGFGCIFAGKYLSKNIAYGRLFFVGFLAFSAIIFLGVVISKEWFGQMPLGVISVAVSVLGGLLTSAVFMCQDLYTSQIARLTSDGRRIFAINYGIIECAQMLGSSYPQLLIERTGQANFFMLLSPLLLLSSLLYFFLPKLSSHVKVESFSVSQLLSCLQQPSFRQIIPIICMGGLSMSFIFADLGLFVYLIYPDLPQETVNSYTARLFTFEGLGALAGGLLLSTLAKDISSGILAYALPGLWALNSIVTAIALRLGAYDMLLVTGLVYGVCDCGFQVVATSMISQGFKEHQKYFALYNLLYCLSSNLGYFASLACGENVFYYFLMVLLVFGVLLAGMKQARTELWTNAEQGYCLIDSNNQQQ